MRTAFFLPLQRVALLVPAGPAEGDTFPDPHNAPGSEGSQWSGGQGFGWRGVGLPRDAEKKGGGDEKRLREENQTLTPTTFACKHNKPSN